MWPVSVCLRALPPPPDTAKDLLNEPNKIGFFQLTLPIPFHGISAHHSFRVPAESKNRRIDVCWIPILTTLCIQGIKSPRVIDAMLDVLLLGLKHTTPPIGLGNPLHIPGLTINMIVPVGNDTFFMNSIAHNGIWSPDGHSRLEEVVQRDVEKSKAVTTSKA